MNKIFYIMGKSASGKDTIYKSLVEKFPQLKTVVLYTTRPKREGEVDGVEYHFITPKKMQEFKADKKLIEIRGYHTTKGLWEYATIEDGQIDLESASYLMMGTLESYLKIKEYYGHEKVVPLYLEVPDVLRLERALNREKSQEIPDCQELCRRFLADCEDFSSEKLKEAGITKSYKNEEVTNCIENIVGVINDGRI
ncbi:MAG TPA: guanylate kinase [Candidatus Dorea intestinavium]|nr:guanylate kinase [Candidatus Dorea intestinavium]